MKKKIIFVMLATCLFCSGCSITTPVGTVEFNYDASVKSDDTVITDDNGNSYTIKTSDMNAYLDQLLESVSLPEGTTTEDLKTFINENLNSLGIDLNNLSNEDIEEINEAIEKSLEENNIDTSDLEVDITGIEE